jgi:hypothetical protein
MRAAAWGLGCALAIAELALCQSNGYNLPSGASAWFPLHVGDRWEYSGGGDSQSPATGVFLREVTGTVKAAGFDWFKVMEAGVERWLRVDAQERLLEFDRSRNSAVMLLDFRAQPEIFSPTAVFCAESATLVRERSGDLRVRFMPRCRDAGISGQTYRQGIGMVEQSSISIAGPKSWRLVRARIDGKDISVPRPAATQLLPDAALR